MLMRRFRNVGSVHGQVGTYTSLVLRPVMGHGGAPVLPSRSSCNHDSGKRRAAQKSDSVFASLGSSDKRWNCARNLTRWSTRHKARRDWEREAAPGERR